MKTIAFILLIIVSGIHINSASCADQDTETEEILLPEWFWNCPEINGVRLAVGYSPSYRDAPMAFQKAFEDAALRLLVDESALYECTQGMLSTPYGLRNLYDGSLVVKDTSNFQEYCATLVRLDSVKTPNIRVMLVGTKAVDVPTRMVVCPAKVVNTDSDGYLWGYGVSQKYLRLSSTWIEAEGQARIQIALSFSEINGIKYTIIEAGSRGDFTSINSAYHLTSNVVLRDVVTVYRRIDVSTNSYMVWVKGKVFKDK